MRPDYRVPALTDFDWSKGDFSRPPAALRANYATMLALSD